MGTKQLSSFFINNFVTVIVLATLILFSSLALAKATSAWINMAPAEIMSRIKPVGEVNINDAQRQRLAEQTQQHHDDMSRGEEVAVDFCNRCHAAGLMHSPKLGQLKDWAPRLEKGIAALQDHAIHGLNKMPARGGRKTLSDADIEAAVDYMLSLLK